MSNSIVTISFNDAMYLLVDAVNQHLFNQEISVNFRDKYDILAFLRFISILVEDEEKIKYISNLVSAMMKVMEE